MYYDDEDPFTFFNLFKELFRDGGYSRSKYIDYNLSERIVDENNIYYTLVTRLDTSNDISIKVTDTEVIITIGDLHKEDIIRLRSPLYLIPNKFDSTFKNGILDIITYIDKERENEETKYFSTREY